MTKTESLRRTRQEICNRLAQGIPLREICSMPEMPSLATVYNWLMPGHAAFDPEFLDCYRVARMWQAEALTEKMLLVSRDESMPNDAKKIQIDALKAASAKLDGRKLGDDKPRQITVKVVYVPAS